MTSHSTEQAGTARTGIGAALELLGAALLGALAGAIAGVAIVDYTDANASHTSIDLAVVAICAAAGLAVGLRAYRRAKPSGDARRLHS